jgi:hypothetical protein
VLFAAVLAAGAVADANAQGTPLGGALVEIGKVEDCDEVTGTSCPPTITRNRFVRIGLDGTLVPAAGRPLIHPPPPAPAAWGVALGASRLRVFAGTAEPWMTVRSPAGSEAAVDWSPSGARFSVTEDARFLVVDPGRQRSWRVRAPRGTEFIEDAEWVGESRLVVLYARDEKSHLAEIDARSGRVVRALSRRAIGTTYGVARFLAWSPAARRLAVTGQYDRVRVIDLAHSGAPRRTPLAGHPSWSPDGRRLLAGGEGSEIRMVTWPELGDVNLPVSAYPTWLPDGSLLALQFDENKSFPHFDRLVQVGLDGQSRVVRAEWPDEPIRIVGLVP